MVTQDLTGVILLFLVSPAVGSFIALLVDRLPRGEDVIRKPSRCGSCQTRLSWRDLVPILSFLTLRGRCRHCGETLPSRLLTIEIAAVWAALLALLATDDTAALWLVSAYLWCLIGLFYTDLTAFRLPDPLTGSLFVIGLGLAWSDPFRTVPAALVAALAGAGSLYLIRVGYAALRGREGMGLGDVKLMAGIGAAVGLEVLPVVLLLASATALVFTLATAWISAETTNRYREVPFGSYLCAAAGIVLLMLV